MALCIWYAETTSNPAEKDRRRLTPLGEGIAKHWRIIVFSPEAIAKFENIFFLI